jgi:hypothetical protein
VNGPVTVTLTATGEDVKEIEYSLGGAATVVAGGRAEVVIEAEGTTTLAYFARNTTGEEESPKSLTVRIDRTAPEIVVSGSAPVYTVDQMVAITVTASDRLSGLASEVSRSVDGPAYRFGVGEREEVVEATDRAGNVGRQPVRFAVRATYEGLSNLTARFVKSGSTQRTLCRALKSAGTAAARRDRRAEAKWVATYEHGVKRLRGKALTAEQVELLTGLARACLAG